VLLLSKGTVILKTVLDNGLLNVLMVYAPPTGKPREEKESFWNELFHLVSCIPQNEMVVLAGDMNRHVESSNVGYDGMHGGYGYGAKNADGSRISGVYTQAKPSNLQHTVNEAGIQAGDICSWFC